MPVGNRELRLVCTAMLLSVGLSASMAFRSPVLGMPLAAALLFVGAQLLGCARRPDPWRTFEQALAELGVVVAEVPDADVATNRAPRLHPAGHRRRRPQPGTLLWPPRESRRPPDQPSG